jgi:hypothetical protein
MILLEPRSKIQKQSKRLGFCETAFLSDMSMPHANPLTTELDKCGFQISKKPMQLE